WTQGFRRATSAMPFTCGNPRPNGVGGTLHSNRIDADTCFHSSDLLQVGEFSFHVWQSNRVRLIVALFAALLGAGVLAAPPSSAGPTVCDYPDCTPGIMGHQVLGAPCDNTTYYAFGVTDGYVSFGSQPGRLMFCGSPRRYQPRWFRSPPMAGVK